MDVVCELHGSLSESDVEPKELKCMNQDTLQVLSASLYLTVHRYGGIHLVVRQNVRAKM